MAGLTPELESEFDALKMQLRGYEVAREEDGNWVDVMRYRPTELGRKQAIATANWLTWRAKQRRQSNATHKVRPVVSIDVDFTQRTMDLDSALVQDFGDIIPREEPATDINNEIQRLATEQRDNRAGGFVTKEGVVPFNYAAEAANAPLPEGF